jgi:hypothetical protein
VNQVNEVNEVNQVNEAIAPKALLTSFLLYVLHPLMLI